MANITERNGKFHVRVYRKDGAVCKSFHFKKDALAWARQTEADIQAGRWRPKNANDGITLGEALTGYQNEITTLKKGFAQETCIINAIKREDIVKLALTAISSAQMASLRDKWMNTLAPATVRRRLAILSHCFEIARKEWLVAVDNPLQSIRKPTVTNSRSRRLKDGEFDAILAASESAELAPIARLAVETAMRLSEIVGLRWRDVNLQSRIVILPETKNGSSRVVPLSPEACDIFASLPRRIDGAVFAVSGPSVTQAWSRAVERARKAYRTMCAKAGTAPDLAYLTDLHFHDLRHEATSRLFERGVFGPMEVAAITGHKTLQMLSRYTHMSAVRLAEKLAASAS